MAGSKHLVNIIDDAVSESLSGLSFVYPRLEYHRQHKVVLAPDYRTRTDKVAVVCGGGSGHEPFSAGFVGSGMLTAAVAGSIFAAPPSVHITHALECVGRNNKAGVFVVVPNYTGDCLNFGIAIQRARQSKLLVEEIFVGEDCSIPDEDRGVAGKRGLTGMIFIAKIAGALAERGATLRDVSKIANVVLENMATFAVGLTACSIPGQGLMFELAEDEIECGMGIHGEAGCERIKLSSAADVISLMLKRLCGALHLKDGVSVAVIINNFGALSQLEQGIAVHEVVTQLNAMGVRPLRVYSGVLTTSLNSAGIHITILKLPDDEDSIVHCLDDPTSAPCWPGCAYSVPGSTTHPPFKDEGRKPVEKVGIEIDEKEKCLMRECLKNACDAIIEKHEYLNELDRGCGDGDCGTTMKRLADGILRDLDNLPLSHPSSLLSELANIAEESMGGTSGALYCLLFTTGAKELASTQHTSSWLTTWSRVFCNAMKYLEKYGKARPGDRTMLDAMDAACTTYENLINVSSLDNFYDEVSDAVWEGCEATKHMKPRAGRASYVRQAQYLQQVDAGAYAVATWISTIAQTIKNYKDQYME